jgi:hypothetical protein
MDAFEHPPGENPYARFPFAFVVDDEADAMENFGALLNGEEPRHVQLMAKACAWCEQNIEPDQWTFDKDVIYLVREVDAFAFKIRWG